MGVSVPKFQPSAELQWLAIVVMRLGPGCSTPTTIEIGTFQTPIAQNARLYLEFFKLHLNQPLFETYA